MQGLITVLRTCPEASLRSMAAVLLRRIFDLMNTTAASKLDASVLAQVKEALVNVLSQEPLSHIARRVALTIGQLAVTQFATWPALLPTVLAMTRHTEPARRATAYETIGKLCEFAFKVGRRMRLWRAGAVCRASALLIFTRHVVHGTGLAPVRQRLADSVPDWPHRRCPGGSAGCCQGACGCAVLGG